MPERVRPRMALLETVRVRNGRVPLWTHHLARLRRSALALGYTIPDEPEPPAGGPERICRLEFASRGRVLVTERRVVESPPLRLMTAPVPHRGYRHKTTDREWLDAARLAAASAGAEDALFLSEDGSTAESSIWSIFWWEGGRLATPPLELGILPGVARVRLAELADGLLESRLPGAELPAHGGFVANAARGVVPLIELDGVQVVPARGTEALARAFWP